MESNEVLSNNQMYASCNDGSNLLIQQVLIEVGPGMSDLDFIQGEAQHRTITLMTGS